MGSLLVVCAVVVVAFIWVRGSRRNRLQWLSRLGLPGTWECEGTGGKLEFTGDADRGSYRIREGERKEEGNWRLEGHTLHLTSAGSKTIDCELRFFSEGKIGIDGPGLERRIYIKSTRSGSNVVPLRGGQKP